MTATFTATPTSATGEIARQIREAHDARHPLRVVGAGTWQNHSTLVDVSDTVTAAGHTDIVEYIPGDLTMTVGAGVTLGTIADATAAHDQWLTLDPFGSTAGTIGATVATASSGPLATAFGTPRDIVLGIEAVTGTGNVIRGGGRVVKNVAGFDLVRLFTGSRGTLGVITEVTVRLRARPAQDVTVAIAIDATAVGLRSVSRALREWPFSPMSAEVIDGACAVAAGLPPVSTLLLRLGGNAKAVSSQRKRAAALGKMTVVDTGVWDRLRAVEAGAAGVMRISDLPSAFAERWNDAQHVIGRNGFILGSPGRGSILCVLAEVSPERIAAVRRRSATATLSFDALPTLASWHSLTTEVSTTSLDSRVRIVFDPAGILNPGIMRVAR